MGGGQLIHSSLGCYSEPYCVKSINIPCVCARSICVILFLKDSPRSNNRSCKVSTHRISVPQQQLQKIVHERQYVGRVGLKLCGIIPTILSDHVISFHNWGADGQSLVFSTEIDRNLPSLVD